MAALNGCGSRQMFHVRGKVSYKDGSVPKGTLAVVAFTPSTTSSSEVRKGASGAIEPDGSFEMVTRMTGDGVNRGEYAVTFRIIQATVNSMVSLVDPKYTRPTSPMFTVKVDRDISDLSFEIEKAKLTAVPPALSGPGLVPGT
jgi:hypothetical protein